MGLSRDMARTADRKHRYWQRVEKERAMSNDHGSDHSREFTQIIQSEKEHYKYLSKIHQLRRKSD
ncbi:hypothetical protein [Sneathiella limimaris]|uniref:hypothetical protein n=1 Tax=Sneathiella limimaris TaxID=1964213 RepID=UPI00146D8ED6|nr:hypothetical protein [Sneathiella limimaris]